MVLVLAALSIGAGPRMRADTTFRIFGYPRLAMLSFLLAAGGGVSRLVSINIAGSEMGSPRIPARKL